jgi:hypothetical protein
MMKQPDSTDNTTPILALVGVGFGMAALLAGAAGEVTGALACGLVAIGFGVSAFT